MAEGATPKGLEQVPRVAAAASLAMLCISVSHDWSYFLGLGITFAEVSTTLQEHLRSALIWAPTTVTGMFIGGLLVLASLGEGRIAKAAASINKTLIWAVSFAGLAVGIWYQSLLLAYVALIIGWIWGSQKALAHEPIRVALFGPTPKFLPLFLAIVLPLLALTTGGIAYQRAYWSIHEPVPRWELVLKSGTGTDTRVVSELRRFASNSVVVETSGRVDIISNDLILEAKSLAGGRRAAASAASAYGPTPAASAAASATPASQSGRSGP